jgi:hypothetical protein
MSLPVQGAICFVFKARLARRSVLGRGTKFAAGTVAFYTAWASAADTLLIFLLRNKFST